MPKDANRPPWGLLALVGMTALGYYALLRRPLPRHQGKLAIKGLGAPVRVIRDRWGIPHIYAENNHDLFAAMGYVHAQDRLWQMECSRRMAIGRFAEMLGRPVLNTDRMTRAIGLDRTAAQEDRQMAPATREVIEAYCEGVNAFLRANANRLSIEFTLLRVRPEPWAPVDVLAIFKLLALGLSFNRNVELINANLLAVLGEDIYRELGARFPLDHAMQIPDGVDYGTFLEPYEGEPGLPPPLIGAQPGSNSWVVAPWRTAEGRPLLANDMHLPAAVPGTFYIVHLNGGDYHAAGFSAPGMPGIGSGHNAHFAWGTTVAMTDVEDWYVIRQNPDDPSLYAFDGGWEKAEAREEIIHVRGQREPDRMTVYVSRFGPILPPEVTRAPVPLALRWTGSQPSQGVGAFLQAMRAKTVEELRAGLGGVQSPSLHLVYAHVDGEIGYMMPGAFPVRAPDHDGLLPVPGWSGAYEWRGIVPPEERPTIQEPPEGVIVTANDDVMGRGYPHMLTRFFAPGERARRLRDRLAEMGRVSFRDCEQMQLDTHSLLAHRTAQALAAVPLSEDSGDGDLPLSPEEARRMIAAWDGDLAIDSAAACLYQEFRSCMLLRTLCTRLETAKAQHYLAQGGHRVMWPLLVAHLDEPEWAWFTAGAHSQEALIAASLRDAVRELRQRLGLDPKRWAWGRLHRPTWQHALGGVGPLGMIFNLRPLALPGDAGTPFATAFLHRRYDALMSTAASRMVCDVGNWDRTVVIVVPGQSGHPASRSYGDQHRDLLVQGRYCPFPFSDEAVRAVQRHALTLHPAGAARAETQRRPRKETAR